MNYYSRITVLISADQVIAESAEQQERIDELLGRIGRAMGAAFSSKPASPYFGQWNPLRGKYEGGLGRDERMAAIKARVAAKNAAKGSAASSGFKTPDQTKLGMPKSMGSIGKLPPRRRVRTPEQEEQSRKNREFAQASRSMMPTTPEARKKFIEQQRAAIKTYTGDGKSERTPQNIRMAQAMGRYDQAKNQRGAVKKGREEQGDTLAQVSSTYYGSVAKMIREAYDLK